MFPEISSLERYLEKIYEEQSDVLFLCEYSHSLNNAVNLKDFWDIIYKESRCFGGCYGEWCNHGIFDGYTEDGRPIYIYGSAIEETYQDVAYSFGGLIHPDGAPSPRLIDYKNVIAPIKVEEIDASQGKFKITNLYDFIFLSRLSGHYEITKQGKVVSTGEMDILTLSPKECAEVTIPYPQNLDGICYIRIFFKNASESESVPYGLELSSHQFLICNTLEPKSRAAIGRLSFTQNNSKIEVFSKTFNYTFSKIEGAFTKLDYKGNQFIKKSMQILADRSQGGNSFKASEFIVTDVVCLEDDDCLKITVHYLCGTKSSIPAISGVVTYIIDGSGKIDISATAKVLEDLKHLPSFGIRAIIPKEYDTLEYFGMGPWENYCNMNNATYMSLFKSQTQKGFTKYSPSEESGNHTNALWCAIYNESKIGLFVSRPEGFDFSLLPYKSEDFMAHKYDHELKDNDHNVLSLNIIHDREITFNISVQPFDRTEDFWSLSY